MQPHILSKTNVLRVLGALTVVIARSTSQSAEQVPRSRMRRWTLSRLDLNARNAYISIAAIRDFNTGSLVVQGMRSFFVGVVGSGPCTPPVHSLDAVSSVRVNRGD